MSLATRNRAIAQDHFFGQPVTHIAERYGLTRRRIAQIIAEHRLSQRVTRRDAFRAMNYRAGGKPIDQALAALPPGDARHYAKLRRIMGAAYARAALGLAA